MNKVYVLVDRTNFIDSNRFIGMDKASGGYPYLTELYLCHKFKSIEDAQSYNTLNYDCKVMSLILNSL